MRGWQAISMAGAVVAGTVASGSSWTLQATPSPKVANGSLAAVTCLSASNCTAVGSYVNIPSGVSEQTWNGASWTAEALPSPTGDTSAQLDAVSCAGTACAAVGDAVTSSQRDVTVAENLSGSTWTVEPTPDPHGSSDNVLLGVSCPSASDCLAVGSNDTGLLAFSWDGASWTALSPTFKGAWEGAGFSGVSCSAVGDCTAVGWFLTSAGDFPLVETWDGTTWSVPSVPAPAGTSFSTLSGVSCPPGSGVCTAVGTYDVSAGDGDTLVEQSSGATWTIVTSPNPSGATSSDLSSVSCSASSTCEAVGVQTTGSGSTPLIEGDTGSGWAIQTAASAGSNPNLAGVACPTPTDCESVGSDVSSTGYDNTLAEIWDGTAWSIQTSADPSGKVGGYLDAVSCSSSTSCDALGDGFSEKFGGGAWTEHAMAMPTGLVAGTLTTRGIACTSATSCVAVGEFRASTGGTTVLAEQWNGSSWRVQAMPQPPGVPQQDGVLDAVSCSSATTCVAVGDYYDGGADLNPLAEVLSGHTWTLSYPSGYGIDQGISCPSPTFCMAVGARATVSGGPDAIAQVWNGTSWSDVDATPAAALNVISCWDPTDCMGLGSSSSAGATFLWNGASWTEEALPANPTGHTYSFEGMSCASGSDCVLVGSKSPTADTSAVPAAAVWAGSSWAVQTTASPPPGLNGFNAASCPPTGGCTAVGTKSANNQELPLAEQQS